MEHTLNKFKYLLNRDTGECVFFPTTMSHDTFQGKTWTSGGFLKFTLHRDECGNPYLKAYCYGESISMKLKSQPEDETIISMLIRPENLFL